MPDGYEPSSPADRIKKAYKIAKKIRGKLSRDDHDPEGTEVSADVPDLADLNLNDPNLIDPNLNEDNIEAESDDKDLQPCLEKDKTKGKFSLAKKMKTVVSSNVGSSVTVGKIKETKDGVGVQYSATGLATNLALGPIDIGGKIGYAEAGAKLWQPAVGLDAGFKANATAFEGHVGPMKASVGIAIDSGVKVGKEGVSVKVLGTGVQLGQNTEISILGTTIGINLWPSRNTSEAS